MDFSTTSDTSSHRQGHSNRSVASGVVLNTSSSLSSVNQESVNQQVVGWGGRSLVRWDLFPKKTKFEDFHAQIWLEKEQVGSRLELFTAKAELDRWRKMMRIDVSHSIKREYCECLGRVSWNEVLKVYSMELGTYDLHHSFWKAMYGLWAHPYNLEQKLEAAVKRTTGWEYHPFDEKKKGFIAELITESKAVINKQLRGRRLRRFRDCVKERAENRPDMPASMKQILNKKARKEKRTFSNKFIVDIEYMGIERNDDSVMDTGQSEIENLREELQRLRRENIRLLQEREAGVEVVDHEIFSMPNQVDVVTDETILSGVTQCTNQQQNASSSVREFT